MAIPNKRNRRPSTVTDIGRYQNRHARHTSSTAAPPSSRTPGRTSGDADGRPNYYPADRARLTWRFAAVIKERFLSIVGLLPIGILLAVVGSKYEQVTRLILPAWLIFIVIIHLFNASSKRRSGQKKLTQMRLVASDAITPCPFGRAFLKSLINSLPTLSYCLILAILLPFESISGQAQSYLTTATSRFDAGRTGISVALLLVFGISFDALRWISAALHREGRSFADLIARTRVISSAAFLRENLQCANCREFFPRSNPRCENCGARNISEIPVINRRRDDEV